MKVSGSPKSNFSNNNRSSSQQMAIVDALEDDLVKKYEIEKEKKNA